MAALPALIRVTKESGGHSGQLWYAAADALAELGPEGAEAVPALNEALSRAGYPFPPFARALWKIDRNYVSLAVRVGIEGLLQKCAITLLAEIGPEASEAAPALIRSLKSRMKELHLNPYGSPEIRALAAIGGAAVPELAEALTSQDVILRVIAADTLGRIGADARAAIPALEKALSDEDDEVRREAAKALGKIRGAAAAPAARSHP